MAPPHAKGKEPVRRRKSPTPPSRLTPQLPPPDDLSASTPPTKSRSQTPSLSSSRRTSPGAAGASAAGSDGERTIQEASASIKRAVLAHNLAGAGEVRSVEQALQIVGINKGVKAQFKKPPHIAEDEFRSQLAWWRYDENMLPSMQQLGDFVRHHGKNIRKFLPPGVSPHMTKDGRFRDPNMMLAIEWHYHNANRGSPPEELHRYWASVPPEAKRGEIEMLQTLLERRNRKSRGLSLTPSEPESDSPDRRREISPEKDVEDAMLAAWEAGTEGFPIDVSTEGQELWDSGVEGAHSVQKKKGDVFRQEAQVKKTAREVEEQRREEREYKQDLAKFRERRERIRKKGRHVRQEHSNAKMILKATEDKYWNARAHERDRFSNGCEELMKKFNWDPDAETINGEPVPPLGQYVNPDSKPHDDGGVGPSSSRVEKGEKRARSLSSDSSGSSGSSGSAKSVSSASSSGSASSGSHGGGDVKGKGKEKEKEKVGVKEKKKAKDKGPEKKKHEKDRPKHKKTKTEERK